MAEKARTAVVDVAEIQFDHQSFQTELVRMIIQYLTNIGFHRSAMTLKDEGCMKEKQVASAKRSHASIRSAILDGEWSKLDTLKERGILKPHHDLWFAISKQNFFELLASGESVKALQHMQQKLVQFESHLKNQKEMQKLCWLLAGKFHQEFKSFNPSVEREKIVQAFDHLLRDSTGNFQVIEQAVPENRLLHLVQQATAYQVGSAMQGLSPESCLSRQYNVKSLLTDYEPTLIPRAMAHASVSAGVAIKCVAFDTCPTKRVFCGGADGIIRVWKPASEEKKGFDSTLKGHTGCIWSLAIWPHHSKPSKTGVFLASGSADGSARLWRLGDETEKSVTSEEYRPEKAEGKTIASDIYSVCFQPSGTAMLASGADGCARLWDITSKKELQVLRPAKSLDFTSVRVTSSAFCDFGNLVALGSSDGDVRFVDLVYGIELQRLSHRVSCDVSSLSFDATGMYLLASYRNSCCRVWDIRNSSTPLCTQRLTGHHSSNSCFVNACFGPSSECIFSGSEDGNIYTWPRASLPCSGHNSCTISPGEVTKFHVHSGVVHDVKWSGKFMVTAASEGVVKIWSA